MKKVIIITGGSRGIGAATAYLASQRGYAVGVNYVHNQKAACKVVEEIVQLGGEAVAVAADVTNEADVVNLFATVNQRLGKAFYNYIQKISPDSKFDRGTNSSSTI